jgi:DNA-binding LacI/PurR family transcriptional regulator
VIALNDIVAIGLLAGFHALGLRVPADLSLVGIDDTQFARLLVPSLTTLRPDYAAMAGQAIDYLHTRLARPGLRGRETILAPGLVVRDSSAAPPPRAGRAKAPAGR